MSPLQKVFKSDFCGFLLLNNFFATEITFFHIYHWNLSHRLFKTLKPVLFQLGILLHVCSSFLITLANGRDTTDDFGSC